MTRDDCIKNIAYKIYLDNREAGLDQFSNGVSDWKDAEDIFRFWDEARMGLHIEGWMSSEDYKNYSKYKRYYDEYNTSLGG